MFNTIEHTNFEMRFSYVQDILKFRIHEEFYK